MSNGYDEISARAVANQAIPVAESALAPQRRFRDTIGPMGEASSANMPPWLRGTRNAQKEGPGPDPYADPTLADEEDCEPPEIEIKVSIPVSLLGPPEQGQSWM